MQLASLVVSHDPSLDLRAGATGGHDFVVGHYPGQIPAANNAVRQLPNRLAAARYRGSSSSATLPGFIGLSFSCAGADGLQDLAQWTIADKPWNCDRLTMCDTIVRGNGGRIFTRCRASPNHLQRSIITGIWPGAACCRLVRAGRLVADPRRQLSTPRAMSRTLVRQPLRGIVV